MTFTYDDYTQEDYDNGILDYMNIPLDYFDDDFGPSLLLLFDLADEF